MKQRQLTKRRKKNDNSTHYYNISTAISAAGTTASPKSTK